MKYSMVDMKFRYLMWTFDMKMTKKGNLNGSTEEEDEDEDEETNGSPHCVRGKG